MNIKNVELLESFFSNLNDAQALVTLTMTFILFLEKEGYSNEKIEQLLIEAKSITLNQIDKNNIE
ncbi:hypothetical protein MHH37_15595 [Solibacillus sp. FSL K6-1781]|uniref:hypothetical protein n=1 Tax=Solibacillus sp. FSL K6-1781 TaxID=2921474 RepID=UPI003159965C